MPELDAEAPTMTTALLACLLLAADPPADPSPPASGPSYEVLRVPDGQSVVVRIDGRVARVGLLGIATPPGVHPGGAERLRAGFLRRALEGQSVRLRRESGPGAEGLAQVTRARDGLWINRELVAAGLAVADPGAPPGRPRFRAEEAEARAGRRGIWSEEALAAAAAEADRIHDEALARSRAQIDRTREARARRRAEVASYEQLHQEILSERRRREAEQRKERCGRCRESGAGADGLCEKCFMDSQK